jgi:hypothetical protein
MAKYDEWLTPDGLLQLEAWARALGLDTLGIR